MSAVALSPGPEPLAGTAGAASAPAPATDRYTRWLADFERRLALRDHAVAAIAADLASRTGGRVFATGAGGFPAPPPGLGPTPNVLCERDGGLPLCLEVALPETLVRRETIRRLRHLGLRRGYELRVVLVARAAEHPRRIAEGQRLLRRAGLVLPLAAIAVDEDVLSGADW